MSRTPRLDQRHIVQIVYGSHIMTRYIALIRETDYFNHNDYIKLDFYIIYNNFKNIYMSRYGELMS